MTPEEKAKELVENFKKHAVGSVSSELIKKFNIEYPEYKCGKWAALWRFAKFERAKQCALDCVGEILEALKNQIIQVDSIDVIYYEKVRKEIIKLKLEL